MTLLWVLIGGHTSTYFSLIEERPNSLIAWSSYVNTSIDGHHLLIPMEESWVLEPKVAVQYTRPYFSCPNKKRKNSGQATRDYLDQAGTDLLKSMLQL